MEIPMPLKGLILSGGRGTRLRPITHTSAKQLVPVANKPILFYGIEAIRDAGIQDIGIIVGDTRDEIEAAVGDGSRWGVRITYIWQSEPLGLAHAVKTARDFIGQDSFVMYLGDNLVKDGITPLVKEFEEERPNAQILLAHVRNPQDFGVAELDGGRIVRLEEKPDQPQSDLALVGVYMFDSTVFSAIDSLKPSARGEYEITDAIQKLIDDGRDVRSHVISGWWKDTGKLEDMLEANRIILDTLEPSHAGEVDSNSRVHGRVRIGTGARLIRSEVRGPAIIGQGCLIEDAFIGPYTSLGDGVTVRHSEVEHSIVLQNSRILDLEGRMADSLIGRNAEVTRDGRRPRVMRMMLGDNSQVCIP
jgi:glucose-1-phosphate thymidylyltransferase